jgi:hypothetical protein
MNICLQHSEAFKEDKILDAVLCTVVKHTKNVF